MAETRRKEKTKAVRPRPSMTRAKATFLRKETVGKKIARIALQRGDTTLFIELDDGTRLFIDSNEALELSLT